MGMTIEQAREIAAQCWCEKTTIHCVVQPEVAEAFAAVLVKRDMGDLDFQSKLEALINECSMENESDTPDFLLALYLRRCLDAFNEAVAAREHWYGRGPKRNGGAGTAPAQEG
jgi:hypothetical protein